MKRPARLLPGTALALALMACFLPVGGVRADDPPVETHGDDLLLGRDMGFGTSGTGAGLWFLDSAQNPDRLGQWLASPHTMIPNITGPEDAGNIYFNLGTNVVTYFDPVQNRNLNTLQSATMSEVAITPGLQMFKGSLRFFAADPATTVLGNTFNYPFLGTFHNHFSLRVFRPGTYQFAFRLTNVVARDGTPLAGSPVYTVTLRSRPALTARVLLPGWRGVDQTPEHVGNKATVFIFPADSAPGSEGEALQTTTVYLDANGKFQLPEGLVPDGSYRVGIKPVTATGLARLLPGNVALSAGTPTDLSAAPLSIPIGDVNRDGVIDGRDGNRVSQASGLAEGDSGYVAAYDVNGDGAIDGRDGNIVAQQAFQYSDFTP